MHMTLPRFAQLLCRSFTLLSRWGDAPSLRSVTGGCSLTLFSHWEMLLHFVQSQGDAPSLRSVANIAPRFASSLGDAPSLHSVANIAPRFASLLENAPSLRSVAGECSLTSFSRWGMLPHFVQSLI